MVKNLALQVAEVWCWGPVTRCNFLSNLSRNAPRKEKPEVCACALVKTAVKLRDKLLGGGEGGDTLCNGYVNCCNPLRKVELSSTSCNASRNNKNWDNPCYTVQFSSDLSPNAIARQVAKKIAQCNRALTLVSFLFCLKVCEYEKLEALFLKLYEDWNEIYKTQELRFTHSVSKV